MKLRPKLPGSPNVYFSYALLNGALAHITWPQDGHFGQTILSAAFGGIGFLGALKGIHGLRGNFVRREAAAEAQNKTTTLGDARFATFSELQAADLHDLTAAMMVGVSDLPLTIPGGMSVAAEAAPGTGKSSAIGSPIVAHALHTGRSCIIQDVKGEYYHLWAEAFLDRGFRVFVNNLALNPSFPNDPSNPFQPIRDAVENLPFEAFPRAETMARTIMKDSRDAKTAFFVSNERAAFVFVVVALAVLHPDDCFPGGVYRAAFNPRRLTALLLEAAESDALGGDLRDLAQSLLDQAENNAEHYQTARTGLCNALSMYKPNSVLGQFGREHLFDIATLRDPNLPPAVVFDIIPAEELELYGPANAIMQTARLQTLRKHREGREIVIVLDEGTNVPAPGLVTAVELLRSFNLQIALLYQSHGSLVKTYGEQEAKALLSSCCEIFLSVSSLDRAKEISERIGSYTVKTTSYGFDEDGKPNVSLSEQSRPYFSPEQILSLSRTKGFLLVPGLRPILFDKVPWYEIEPFKSWAGENPHERHPRSNVVRLHLTYGPNAQRLHPPIVRDRKRRVALALAAERAANKRIKAPRFRLRDHLWLPLAASAAFGVFAEGTPHLLLQGMQKPSGYQCLFLGLSGSRIIEQPAPCKAVQFIRFKNRSRAL